jgi:hypothetical protein
MGFLSGLGKLLGSRPPPENALREAIERAVDAVDPRLKVVSDYEGRLAPAVAHALRHCAAVAAAIPGPVEIGSRAFAADPLVHALFAAPGDISDMLGKSREVREFFADPANAGRDEFFGLLGMRQRYKAVAGVALNGDVVQHGVPQRLLYFADHTLGELGSGHEVTRRRLQEAAFDGLVRGFAHCVEELRQEHHEARTAWQMERASVGERRQELEERQRLAIASLAPEKLLDAFAVWLAASEQRLYLKPTEVMVDRMGVISPTATTGDGYSTLNFPELVARDRRQWIVLVARISRQDALDALERRQQANRYLLI